ncbi:MAG: hypothetical protein OEY52_05670 [Gammaproteobacteria bacterium]|nr:hypothetical protein [Gammaproteobacteria bacterium]
MKLMNVFGFSLVYFLMSTTAHGGINTGTTSGILSSKEKCAAALNSYLSYRHESHSEDAYKIQKLENQVDALCEGYQIQLMENEGVMTGVVELAE